MSADELRQAAETLRARAQASSRAPWVVDGEGDLEGTEVRAARGAGPTVAQTVPLGYERRRANAAYIATMHPGVGLALADWLDDEAKAAGYHENRIIPSALTIARLINGGAS